jgi:hypothetical protein
VGVSGGVVVRPWAHDRKVKSLSPFHIPWCEGVGELFFLHVVCEKSIHLTQLQKGNLEFFRVGCVFSLAIFHTPAVVQMGTSGVVERNDASC